ncbi:inositol-tetrakisphosphate 1-kinase [Tachysurus ichikawai]
MLDLSQPLEEQGPLDVIIHKLTDLILEADQNDTQSLLLVQRVQDYIDAHPETIVLDPLPAIRTLLDRCKSYQLVHRIEACMQAVYRLLQSWPACNTAYFSSLGETCRAALREV